jgi:hypothetical protein
MNVQEFIWPRLEKDPPTQAAQDAEQRKLDLEAIMAADLGAEHIDTLIEEARRLTDAEAARRTGADTRATTYLAIVGVLAPILAALAPAAITTGGGVVRPLVTLVLFLAAGAYLIGCGIWSFRVLRVSTGARLDAVDYIRLWARQDPRDDLARKLLYCVRWSRGDVNYKVSCIKMAHEFAIRALATFVLTMGVRAAWDPVLALGKALRLFD